MRVWTRGWRLTPQPPGRPKWDSARIVYTPADTTFLTLNLDLNHDGIADFRFNVSGALFFASIMSVLPLQDGNAILGKPQGVLSRHFGGPFTCRAASALPAGHSIGPGGRFGAYRTMRADYPITTYGTYYPARRGGPKSPISFVVCGNWPNAQAPFLGLEFTAQGQKHFGWARFNWVNGFPRLTGYAYETDPDKAIRAGDTGPVADARVPELHSATPAVATLRPVTLGLLALGSRGLDIWRKEQ